MMRVRTFCLAAVLTLSALPVLADAVVASRNIRSHSVLMPSDLSIVPESIPGAMTDPDKAIGLEAKVTLYAGRPVRPEDLGPPAILERNDVVPLHYHHAGLSITTEGRVLSRAGVGDTIRVMNLSSRTTVSGVVLVDGSVNVAPSTR